MIQRRPCPGRRVWLKDPGSHRGDTLDLHQFSYISRSHDHIRNADTNALAKVSLGLALVNESTDLVSLIDELVADLFDESAAPVGTCFGLELLEAVREITFAGWVRALGIFGD